MQDSDRGRLLMGHQELLEFVAEGAPGILQTSQGRRQTVVQVARSEGSPILHSWVPSVSGPVRAPHPTLRMLGAPPRLCSGHCPGGLKPWWPGKNSRQFRGPQPPGNQVTEQEVSSGRLSEASSVFTATPHSSCHHLSSASISSATALNSHRSVNASPKVKTVYPEIAPKQHGGAREM